MLGIALCAGLSGSFMNVNVLEELPNLITEFGLRDTQTFVGMLVLLPINVPSALSMSMIHAIRSSLLHATQQCCALTVGCPTNMCVTAGSLPNTKYARSG